MTLLPHWLTFAAVPSSQELRRLQAETRKAIEELEAQLTVLREQEVTLGDLAAKMETAGLHIGSKRSNLRGNMQVATKDAPLNVRIAAGRTRREIAAKQMLLDAGHSDRTAALALGVGRSTLNAWLNGRLAVPARYWKAARDKWDIPRAAWPKTSD